VVKNKRRLGLVLALALVLILVVAPTLVAYYDPGGGGCGGEQMGACARIKGYYWNYAARYQKLASAYGCYGCVPVNYVGSVQGGTPVYVIARYYNPCMGNLWYYAAGFGWIDGSWIQFESCEA